MTPSSLDQPQKTSARALRAILLIGLIAGTLDLIAAIVTSQANPVIVCKFIASGAFGREAAFSGGLVMAFYGLLFHFLIAYSWTILFFFLYPRFTILSKNRVIAGLLYGIIVWIVMNRIVLPLSQIKQGPFEIISAIKGAVILMLMIGLPISLLTHRYYSRKTV